MFEFFTRCQRLSYDQRWLSSNIDIIFGPRNHKNWMKIKTSRQHLLCLSYRVSVDKKPQFGHLLRKEWRNEGSCYTQKLFSELPKDSQVTEFETHASRMGVRPLSATLGTIVRLRHDSGLTVT
jgi:hypothetical protein